MSLIPGPPRSQVQTHSLSTQNLKPYTLNPNPRTAIQVLALLLGKDKGSGGKMVHGTTAFGDTLLLFMATAAPLVTPDPLIPHPEASRKLNSGVVCEQAGH